jgi:hypothetical protein
MFTSWKSRAAVFAVAAMGVPVLGLASPAGAAAGGNSANAHACQKGGWQTAQTGTGAAFASQDECVSYGAHGGTVFTPHIQNTVDCFSGSTRIVTIGTGFHPNSTGHLVLTVVQGSDDEGGIGFVPTDANGNVGPSSFLASSLMTGVWDVTASFQDASGVHASSVTQHVDMDQCRV